MRGSTVKKINKFVDMLILNTPEGELDKTREQLVSEMKVHWQTKGKAGRKFVDKVIDGSFFNENINKK